MKDEPIEVLVEARERQDYALKMAAVVGRWIFLCLSVIFINLSVCANGNARRDAAAAEGYAEGMKEALGELQSSKD